MGWRQYAPLVAGLVVVVATQIGCTAYLVHEGRRNYAANVVETFKACTGKWNPWEKYPWQK